MSSGLYDKMMTEIHLQLTIPTELHDKRLDQALAILLPEYSRSRIQSWIQKQQVSCNGQYYRAKEKIQQGDEILIDANIEAHGQWQSQAIDLCVIYEDESLIVINKPPGIIVHPGAGNPDGTLVNALLHYAPELAKLPRAGIIHRLDKNTSGLLVIAKSLPAHTVLIRKMQQREITRIYHALVQGTMVAGGTIDEPIARHPIHRQKMAVMESGRTAITHYRVLKRYHSHTLLQVQLETGRTHQIRVHMAHRRYPIVGDTVYGKMHQKISGYAPEAQMALQQFKRQALHAYALALEHPESREMMSWEAPYPEDFRHLINVMG